MMIETKYVIAIDVGTHAGWAMSERYYTGDSYWEQLQSGAITHNPKKGQHPGYRFAEFERELQRLCDDRRVEAIAYEEPMGNFKNHHAARVIFGYVAVLLQYAERRRIPVRSYPQKTLKKHATGNGNAKKEQMLAAARKKWPEQNVETDDQADALWLLDLDQYQQQRSKPCTPETKRNSKPKSSRKSTRTSTTQTTTAKKRSKCTSTRKSAMRT